MDGNKLEYRPTETETAEVVELLKAAFSTARTNAEVIRVRVREFARDRQEHLRENIGRAVLRGLFTIDQAEHALTMLFSEYTGHIARVVFELAKLSGFRLDDYTLDKIGKLYWHASGKCRERAMILPPLEELERFLISQSRRRERTEIQLNRAKRNARAEAKKFNALTLGILKSTMEMRPATQEEIEGTLIEYSQNQLSAMEILGELRQDLDTIIAKRPAVTVLEREIDGLDGERRRLSKGLPEFDEKESFEIQELRERVGGLESQIARLRGKLKKDHAELHPAESRVCGRLWLIDEIIMANNLIGSTLSQLAAGVPTETGFKMTPKFKAIQQKLIAAKNQRDEGETRRPLDAAAAYTLADKLEDEAVKAAGGVL